MRVVLAIDTARNSGWCLTADGKYVDSGECDAYGDAPREVCRRAVELDAKAELLLETAFGGSLATLRGLGAARGCWLSAWRWATGKKTTARIRSVMPQTWRAALFGATAGFALQEKLTAQVFSRKTDPAPDEAAAICIARWASVHAAKKTTAGYRERGSSRSNEGKQHGKDA